MGQGPDSDSLPYSWLTQRLDSIERRMTDHNAAMRADMNTGFRDLSNQFREHETEDRGVERRVHDIEEREKTAAATVTKRNMMASGGIAAILGPASAYIFKKWLG